MSNTCVRLGLFDESESGLSVECVCVFVRMSL